MPPKASLLTPAFALGEAELVEWRDVQRSVDTFMARLDGLRRRVEDLQQQRVRIEQKARSRSVAGKSVRRSVPPPGGPGVPGLTATVVMAAVAKLGEATAAEIAAEVQRAQRRSGLRAAPPHGQAVRRLAEKGGARIVTGPDGRRRYRVR